MFYAEQENIYDNDITNICANQVADTDLLDSFDEFAQLNAFNHTKWYNTGVIFYNYKTYEWQNNKIGYVDTFIKTSDFV